MCAMHDFNPNPGVSHKYRLFISAKDYLRNVYLIESCETQPLK